jgi:uncharacterized protein YoxC
MNKLIKILKILALTITIIVGIAILAVIVFLYKGVKSGDLSSYLTKTAIDKMTSDSNLTDEQREMLESGDYEGLVENLEENLTSEQIDCAVQAVGEERAKELSITKDPTPQEMLKLSKCL